MDQSLLPQVSLFCQHLGRLELGTDPYVVESFQVGSPALRDNVKNRSLADGVFDDTHYHGASAFTLSTRLKSRYSRGGDRVPGSARFCDDSALGMGVLRDRLVAYAHPRHRIRLGWRYPYETVGRWAEVRGASWPFDVSGPKYPLLVVQFTNPLGSFFVGDLADTMNTATASPGLQADGRSYPLTFDRDYPNISNPAGTAIIVNEGNDAADWVMTVNGPFDAGATVVLGGIEIEFNQALLVNETVTLRSMNRTVLHNNGLSYYPYTNFGDWSWERLELEPGETLMTFDGVSAGGPSGWATIQWYSTSI